MDEWTGNERRKSESKLLLDMVKDLKQSVADAITIGRKNNSELIEHKIWEEGYHREETAKDYAFKEYVKGALERIENQTVKTNGRVTKLEDRQAQDDVWRAGFLGHIKGLWAAMTLISVLFGILQAFLH